MDARKHFSTHRTGGGVGEQAPQAVAHEIAQFVANDHVLSWRAEAVRIKAAAAKL